MTTIVYFTDAHLRPSNPENRIDDYSGTMLEKLREIVGIINRKADFAIFGGDFFHSHAMYSYTYLGKVFRILRKLKKDVYFIVGSHDLVGYNEETFGSSAIGFLSQFSKMHFVKDYVDVGNSRIFACHASSNLEESLRRDVESIDGSRGKFNILVCHHMISRKRQMFDTVCVDDIGKCAYDLVLTGHYHKGYKSIKRHGTWYCNPGGMSRGTIDSSDIQRTPKVSVIRVDAGVVKIRSVSLKSARAAEDVFDLVKVEKEKAQAMELDEFKNRVDQLSVSSVDVFDLIEKVYAKEGDEDVVKMLLSYRGKVGNEA